jgi:predicted RNA methylase/predicted Ser/Thr protein kinase
MTGNPSIVADGFLEPAAPPPDPPLSSAQPLPGCGGLHLERCWQSRLDPARRYGVAGDWFYKIALPARGVAPPARGQDLLGEARMLWRCQGIPGIPEIIGWSATGGIGMLITRRLEARPLSPLEVGWGRLLGLQLQLALMVVRLAWRGISHDDLRPENILVDDAGRAHLVDFDQASSGSFGRCLARSLLGLGLGGAGVSNGLLAPVRERVQASLSPALLRLLKGRRNRSRQSVATALPPLPPDAGAELCALHAAWRIAAASPASSPGRAMAYYALEFGGLSWPGERPWAERWRVLRQITAWRGRRVLELGCNLGLLSIFLLKEEAALAALAVDRDDRILAAGAEAARAFRVRPEFRRLDFDRDADWETPLLAFRPDVVVALSVLNWVADRARLLAFLGRCAELVYEGHDSARTERRRLHAAGFTRIELVATSERGRPILHCRKGRHP